MYTEITKNKRNSALLVLTFLIITVGIAWVFAEAFGNSAILYIVTFIALLYAWISYFNSDKMVLAVSGAHEVKKADAPELYRVVENLAITAGLPTPRVFVINDAAPNAFATGRDPEHAVVCVTGGLLEKLDKTELEGVIAHELSHVGNYDIRLMSLIAVLVSIIALLSDFFLRWSFFGGGGRRRGNGDGDAQIIFVVLAIVLAIVAPIIGLIIQLAVSRKREYLADASGALLTRYPEGLANALRKIDSDAAPLKEANKATANMYIINPLRDGTDGHHGAKTFAAGLFSTHPPTADRIKRLDEMEIHA